MDRATLRSLEDRIMLELVAFYYGEGHKSEAYMDPEHGGIYDTNLRSRWGI